VRRDAGNAAIRQSCTAPDEGLRNEVRQAIAPPKCGNGMCRVLYQFRYLSDGGCMTSHEDRECAGDLGALVYARRLAPYRTIEIWDGPCRVAYIPKGEDPLNFLFTPQ
jgi:hypothetical protein